MLCRSMNRSYRAGSALLRCEHEFGQRFGQFSFADAVGPRNMKVPIGRRGSFRPARLRRTALLMASIAPAVRRCGCARRVPFQSGAGFRRWPYGGPGCRSTLRRLGDVVADRRGWLVSLFQFALRSERVARSPSACNRRRSTSSLSTSSPSSSRRRFHLRCGRARLRPCAPAPLPATYTCGDGQRLRRSDRSPCQAGSGRDIARRKIGGRFDRFVGDLDVVMLLVRDFDALQNFTVSSIDGSDTRICWKRRSSAASLSMCLRYSSRVVAPMHCNSPRASAGFKILAASTLLPAEPAPRACDFVDEQDAVRRLQSSMTR